MRNVPNVMPEPLAGGGRETRAVRCCARAGGQGEPGVQKIARDDGCHSGVGIVAPGPADGGAGGLEDCAG